MSSEIKQKEIPLKETQNPNSELSRSKMPKKMIKEIERSNAFMKMQEKDAMNFKAIKVKYSGRATDKKI